MTDEEFLAALMLGWIGFNTLVLDGLLHRGDEAPLLN